MVKLQDEVPSHWMSLDETFGLWAERTPSQEKITVRPVSYQSPQNDAERYRLGVRRMGKKAQQGSRMTRRLDAFSRSSAIIPHQRVTSHIIYSCYPRGLRMPCAFVYPILRWLLITFTSRESSVFSSMILATNACENDQSHISWSIPSYALKTKHEILPSVVREWPSCLMIYLLVYLESRSDLGACYPDGLALMSSSLRYDQILSGEKRIHRVR
jgi:hypothetical protein